MEDGVMKKLVNTQDITYVSQKLEVSLEYEINKDSIFTFETEYLQDLSSA